MDEIGIKAKIKSLVDKYESAKAAGQLKSYTEEETKKDFILPLFEILGWDVYNKKEVSAEEHIKSSGRVDYGFYLNGRAKFFLEAKKFSADLHTVDFAKQAIRYSWNRGVTWAVLTDFENIKVFNSQDIGESLAAKQFFDLPCQQFVDKFDLLRLLSKGAFENDWLDKKAEEIGKKLQRVPIGEKLYKDLNECREILTQSFARWNKDFSKDFIDEGVQKILDRLIFIRVVEDRGIEPPTLKPLLREWQVSKTEDSLFKFMLVKFKELDAYYDSNIFSRHAVDDWDEHEDALKEVISILYGKDGYYEYDFKIIPADVLGAVYENYLGYKLAQSKKGITLDKDARKRKEQGIYYTPSYIVDYIVRNTLGPVLDKCVSIADLQKIKVLDPACGSGSFLLKALEVIHEKYEELGNHGGSFNKLQILVQNIYGVDLDPQAIELARLNLLLGSLEEKMPLPNLSGNIKNGNSLISGTDEELRKYFGPNFRDKKPFNWGEEFPEVFAQGGFDVIIGNPPWVTLTHKEIGLETLEFLKDKYLGAEGFKLNLFPLFLELGINLLKENGIVSLILPDRLLDTPSYRGVRSSFIGKYQILDIQNIPAGSFHEVVAGNIILAVQKTKNKKEKIIVSNFETKEKTELLLEDILKSPNLTININSDAKAQLVIKKIRMASTVLLKDICDIHVGMMVRDKKLKFVSEPRYKNTIVVGRDLEKYFIHNKNYFDIEDIEIFGGTKNKSKHQESPKLLVRKTGNKIICSLDTEGVFAEQSVYLVLLRDNNFNIKFLCAYLNSKLTTFYFQNELITNPEAYPYIQHYDLESMPVINSDVNKQVEIVKYFDQIADLHKERLNQVENSNEWQKLKDQIEKTDKKIDEEIYKLYGLTAEEIKIVENSS
ncbi:MAG: TaqI-like C-terminal specificity domain-containing protein [Patescibacteria group bacterium]